ncbi:hypothetical protein MIR68_000464 [Amoeboaphelidium protococcarum]|nr:hypothetical protein MIR68_000464 [Amoeboaphelidium protococcarum]
MKNAIILLSIFLVIRAISTGGTRDAADDGDFYDTLGGDKNGEGYDDDDDGVAISSMQAIPPNSDILGGNSGQGHGIKVLHSAQSSQRDRDQGSSSISQKPAFNAWEKRLSHLRVSDDAQIEPSQSFRDDYDQSEPQWQEIPRDLRSEIEAGPFLTPKQPVRLDRAYKQATKQSRATSLALLSSLQTPQQQDKLDGEHSGEDVEPSTQKTIAGKKGFKSEGKHVRPKSSRKEATMESDLQTQILLLDQIMEGALSSKSKAMEYHGQYERALMRLQQAQPGEDTGTAFLQLRQDSVLLYDALLSFKEYLIRVRQTLSSSPDMRSLLKEGASEMRRLASLYNDAASEYKRLHSDFLQYDDKLKSVVEMRIPAIISIIVTSLKDADQKYSYLWHSVHGVAKKLYKKSALSNEIARLVRKANDFSELISKYPDFVDNVYVQNYSKRYAQMEYRLDEFYKKYTKLGLTDFDHPNQRPLKNLEAEFELIQNE